LTVQASSLTSRNRTDVGDLGSGNLTIKNGATLDTTGGAFDVGGGKGLTTVQFGDPADTANTTIKSDDLNFRSGTLTINAKANVTANTTTVLGILTIDGSLVVNDTTKQMIIGDGQHLASVSVSATANLDAKGGIFKQRKGDEKGHSVTAQQLKTGGPD